MKSVKRDFIYLHKQEAEHFVASFGIDFCSFMQAVNEPPENLLLLDHPFMDVEFDMHTHFNYVTYPSYKRFCKENGKEIERLVWMDFEDIDGLEELAPWEIAEILYVRHTFNHLRSPFYQKMNNRFVYLTQEDGLYNKIYYRSWADFYEILSAIIPEQADLNKAERGLFGAKRKVSIQNVPQEMIKQLSPIFTEGAIISFEKSINTRQAAEIPIWSVGDFSHEDDLEYELRNIYRTRQTAKLVFHKKQKEWALIR